MLSMGFWEDVTAILDKVPAKKQMLLFSATLPDAIRKTALSQMREPVTIDISRDELTVEGITNIFYETNERLPKPRNLLYLLEVERPENAIIFCNTRDDTSTVAAFLRRQGLNALALSGELSQRDREIVMGRMKRGALKYLVATDIAARGIDISDLSHVVNYSLPEFTEVYIHRIGRTGRVGKKGTAIALVSGRDEITLTALRNTFHIDFEKRVLPESSEITKLQAARVVSELVKEAREVEITGALPLAERLIEAEGAAEVVAFLLKGYFAELEEAREREDSGFRRSEAKEEPRRAAPARREAKREDRGPSRRRTRDNQSESVRLFINRGTSDGYEEDQVQELVLQAAGLSENDAAPGRVQLRRTHAFLEVSESAAEAAVRASEQGIEREEKPVTIERARTRG